MEEIWNSLVSGKVASGRKLSYDSYIEMKEKLNKEQVTSFIDI